MKHIFSKELNRQLLSYYGRMPSASIFARDFNLRTIDSPQISQETARRWMRGLSIPDLDKLQIIIHWLNLDLPFLTGSDKTSGTNEKKIPKNSHQYNEVLLIKAYRETDLRGKQILMSAAHLLTSGKIPPDLLP